LALTANLYSYVWIDDVMIQSSFSFNIHGSFRIYRRSNFLVSYWFCWLVLFLLLCSLWPCDTGTIIISARQHICYSALYAIARPSVCLSVCPSHGWISQRWL